LGNSLNVNLVPEQYQPEASVRDRVFAASLVGGAVLLVVVAALGLYFYQQRLETKVASIDQQILLVNQEVTSRERDDMNDAIILQQRTGDVKRVLDQHVYWDVFFQKLEGVTLPTVAYTTMSVDVAGSVTLMAQAKTYDDVGAQLLTYQQAKDFITEVNISAATKVSSSPATSRTGTPPGQTAQPPQSLVTFSVSMRVNPALFYHR
jgi:Tfp pilus assembly protein PilN